MNLQTGNNPRQFVFAVNTGIWRNWGTSAPLNRATQVWNALVPVVRRCGFTVPEFRFEATFGNAAAYFTPADWRVVIGQGMCPDGANQGVMLELLRTVYHETRHCEQFFHCARYIAANSRSPTFLRNQTEVDLSTFRDFLNGPNGKDINHPRMKAVSSEYIHRRTGINRAICDSAVEKPMKSGDEMFDVAKGMYDSMYAPGIKRALAQLTNHTTIHIRYNQGAVPGRAYQSAYDAYFDGSIPYEEDALATELLVNNVITTNGLFS
jgi:hypothetical protein